MRRPAPRFYKLSYLVTAWTQRPEDEHRLLDTLLRAFLKYDALPERLVVGPLAEPGESVKLTVGLPPPEDRAFADVWSALGGELKPSLDLVVFAPMWTGREYPAGPPVKEGLTIDAHDLVDGGGDVGRQQPVPPPVKAPARRRRCVVTGPGSLVHVLGRLGVIEERIRHLVAVRRADDPAPDDPFRGLYLSDDAVDRLLVGPQPPPDWTEATERMELCEAAADRAEDAGAVLRLRDLAATFGLDPVDLDLLLVGIAADVDPRFESFFGYLNDDVSRRRPSVAVALELAGASLTSMSGHAHLLHGPS